MFLSLVHDSSNVFFCYFTLNSVNFIFNPFTILRMIAMKTFRYFYEVLFTVFFNNIFKLVVISIINSFWYQVVFVGF